MKPVKVRYTQRVQYNLYQQTNPDFAFCTPLSKNRIAQQAHAFKTCREDLGTVFRKHINKGTFVKIDTNKIRLLTCHKTATNINPANLPKARKEATKMVLAGIKLLNHFEGRAKWPKTKVYMVDNTGKLKQKDVYSGKMRDMEPFIHVYMTVGSNKWLKNPYYLSLYILMLRLGKSGFKAKFKNHKEVMEELRKFGKKSNGHNDIRFTRNSFKKWDLLLKNQAEILKSRKSMAKAWSTNTLRGPHNGGYNEGIDILVNGNARDLDVAARFQTVCKRYRLPQECRITEINRAVRSVSQTARARS